MTDTPEMNALREIAKEKEDRYNKIHDAYLNRRRELEKELHNQLEKEFGVTIMDAQKALMDALKNYRNAGDIIKINDAISKAPFPEGTILEKWYLNVNHDSVYTKANEVGTFQIFRDGDKFPKNARWTPHSVGAQVVRIHKKDGSLGIQVEPLNSYAILWSPQHIDPNVELKKKGE